MGENEKITADLMKTPPWDDRFICARLVLGLAAACWILWCPFLGRIPDQVFIGLAVILAVAMALGRLSRMEWAATALMAGAGVFGWWSCRHGLGDVFAYLSALPAAGLLWALPYRLRAVDSSGLWALPHARGTALGCWAIAACGLSSVLIWLMDGTPGFQLPLLWAWMTISFWPTLEANALMKRLAMQEGIDPAVRDEIGGYRFGDPVGIWFAPWVIICGAHVIDALTKPHFETIIRSSTRPLATLAAPVAMGMSAFFSIKLLWRLLEAWRLTGSYTSVKEQAEPIPATTSGTQEGTRRRI